MRSLFRCVLGLLLSGLPAPLGAQMPSDCTQAVVGITDGWNSSEVSLSVVERSRSGGWQRVLGPFRGRLGRNGTVWGRGLHPPVRGAAQKREGDGRSPAGIFALGGLWVTNATPVRHDARIPYVRVTPADLWVTDERLPKLYNRWVRLDHPAATPWELHEQMRQTDDAHSIKLLVCHNTPDVPGGVVVGGGAAIFFHIWRRGGALPTAGCTAMDEGQLRALIARLQASRHPVYILLPRAEYARLRAAWQLP